MSETQNPSVLELIQRNYQRRIELAESIRGVAEAATTEQRQLTEAEQAEVDRFRAELDTVDKRTSNLIDMRLREERITSGISGVLGAMVDRDRREVVDTRTLGQRFTDADAFRAHMKAGGRGQYAADFDGVSLRAVTTVDGSSNVLAGVDRLNRIGQANLDRRLFLADLIPHITVGSSAVEYVSDATAASGYDGAAQTEGTGKSEATPDLDVVTEPIRTIAKWAGVTRQVYDDWGQLAGYLDGRLRYGLARALDTQVANGNGTPPNLTGLGQRSGIATHAPGSVEEAAVSVRKAITVGEQNEAVYEIVVLNPVDAEKFDLLNQATAGIHSVPNTAGSLPTTAWGLRRVVSNAVASGTALLIDPMAVALLDREQVTARLSESHDDFFTKNILTLLLECRVGLALFAAKGVCKVTFKYV